MNKKLTPPKTAPDADHERYPRPPEYRRAPLKPVQAGTVAFRHTPEGVAECFLLDGTGKQHLVNEWELTQAELSARLVADPDRRSHLFNPGRSVYPGDADDDVDRAQVTSARAMLTYATRLAATMGTKG
jgi:hypothetical protein